jgi:hypothetical protein
VPLVHAKIWLEPVNFAPAVGKINVAPFAIVWNAGDGEVFRFRAGVNAGFNDIVAVSVSALSTTEIIRLLKIADPPDRPVEAVPLSSPSLSVIETELLAAAPGIPFSVNATEIAGDIAWPTG